MLRQAVNELIVTVEIRGQSFVLVKDGRYEKPAGDDRLPAFVFVSRTPPERLLEVVRGAVLSGRPMPFYIPGSSVRGAWRSYLEKVLRSLDEPEHAKVCDPHIAPTEVEDAVEEIPEDDPYASCSGYLVNRELPHPAEAYKLSCPVCQLFGNTAQGSRLAFEDAEFHGGNASVMDNVAISRQTGSVIAPFKSLGIRDAKFALKLRLRNFELWQLGLLARLFGDLGAGRAPLGSGKNKGWGRIEASATEIELSYFGLEDAIGDGKLRGIGDVPGADLSRYGMSRAATLPGMDLPVDAGKSSLWRHTRVIANIPEFWEKTKPCFDAQVWRNFRTLSARRALVEVPSAGA